MEADKSSTGGYEIRAGFHTADITPPVGLESPGNYGKAYIQKIHDRLKARAAVFEANGTTLAFVGLDTLAMPFSLHLLDTTRQEIERTTGISGDNVMLAASHTHSGGPLNGLAPSDFVGAPDLVQTLVREYSINCSPIYQEWVSRQIVTAVHEAQSRKQEALLSVGTGVEDKVLFNRRFRMANGRVYTHPGKGNPEIIEPAGPVDPEVGVLAAWSVDGELLGCLVNYGCHSTTSPGGASADYIHYLERTIHGVMGPEAVVVFLLGAAGDVTQVDNRSTREREFGEVWSRRVGTCVGAEAIKVLATAEQGYLQPLASAASLLRIPRRRPSAARVDASRRLVENGLRTGQRDTAWTFAKEIVVLDYLAHHQPEMEVEVQAFQIGPAVFLANPAEYFAESGLGIKAASPFPYTFIVTLANSCAGYTPPANAFAPDGGGYETVLTTYSNLDISAADQIASASLQLISRLTPGTMPKSPWGDGPQQPWSYGVLGPDIE